MPPTPLQTYLAERLQSARGLGWPMPDSLSSQPEPTARPAPLSASAPASTWPDFFAAWLRGVIR